MSTACSVVRSPGHHFPGHEEDPGRLQSIGEWGQKPYAVTLIEPRPAPYEDVIAVHSKRMLSQFEAACRNGPGITDFAPTFVTTTTFADAFLAAGAVLDCTRQVLEGRVRNAFAIVRPPGHHAEPEAAMGFCLLNNIAIAARHALNHGLERVLIMDFDAHHGNGTQAVFLEEPRAAYLSTQQENIYPFRSGHMQDAPNARGRIINIPLPARSGDAAFARICTEVLHPLVVGFKPEMIFVSAGFDSHWNDPLAELGLSSAGYHAITRSLKDLADEVCAGRLVFSLEGGYNPLTVAAGVDAVLSVLADVSYEGMDPSPYPEPDIENTLRAVRELHHLA